MPTHLAPLEGCASLPRCFGTRAGAPCSPALSYACETLRSHAREPRYAKCRNVCLLCSGLACMIAVTATTVRHEQDRMSWWGILNCPTTTTPLVVACRFHETNDWRQRDSPTRACLLKHARCLAGDMTQSHRTNCQTLPHVWQYFATHALVCVVDHDTICSFALLMPPPQYRVRCWGR